MASGDSVVQILKVIPPGASAATMDARAGGSTPAENVAVWDFDASSDEYMDFMAKLEGYGSSGLSFTLYYSMSSATADSVVWGIAIRRVADDAEDIDTSHSYSFNTTTDTVPNTSGEVGYASITFTDGADMDSWAEGELAIVRVMRDADNGSDNASGDAELWSVVGLET